MKKETIYLAGGCFWGTEKYLSLIPGVLSMASDYARFARALAGHGFTVHTMERRGRGGSGPQGNGYSIVKECEDVLALRAETGASFLVGHRVHAGALDARL